MAATNFDPAGEKPTEQRLDTVRTNERVPGHPGYYEKDGLRTYGDGVDHDHEAPACGASDSRLQLRANPSSS